MKKKYRVLLNGENPSEGILFRLEELTDKIIYETTSKLEMTLKTERKFNRYEHKIKVDKNVGIGFEQYFKFIEDMKKNTERLLNVEKNLTKVELFGGIYILQLDLFGIRRLIKRYHQNI